MRRATQCLLFATAFLCVAAAHVWMIWMAPNALSFSEGHVHTDNAVMPLMGKHMLDKGEFPIFYYGQHYMGSLEPLLVAAGFTLFGKSNVVLLAVPLVFALALVPLIFLVAFFLLETILVLRVLGEVRPMCKCMSKFLD